MSGETKTPTGSAPALNLFSLGADLLGEVQRHSSGNSRVRALRLKLGNRTIKEFPVGQMTAIATIGLVLVAVLVSTLTVEVDHAPNP